MTVSSKEVYLSTILPAKTFATLAEAEHAEQTELLIQLLESDAAMDRESAENAVHVIQRNYHLTWKEL